MWFGCVISVGFCVCIVFGLLVVGVCFVSV